MSDTHDKVSLDNSIDSFFLAAVFNESASLEDDFEYCRVILDMAKDFVKTNDITDVINKNEISRNRFCYGIKQFCSGNIEDGKYNNRAMEFLSRFQIPLDSPKSKYDILRYI